MQSKRNKPTGLLLFKNLQKKIKNIYQHKHTIWHVALAQTKAKHVGNFLGIWVAAINPLLIMVAISFVFTKVIRLDIENFPLFALAGIFPWMFFSGAVCEAASSIVSQQAIMRQFSFSKEYLPLACVISNFLIFLIGWIIICPIFICFKPSIIKLLPLLIIGLFLSLVFVSGIGIIFGVLNVIWRDLSHLLGTIMMFWFWMTPVFYSIEMVPYEVRWICAFNPMSTMVIYYRTILFYGQVPQAMTFLGLFLISIISAILGLVVAIVFEGQLLKKM
jgi:lipopolysaccharide transport system permease protein